MIKVILPDQFLVPAGVGSVETKIYPNMKINLVTRPGILGAGRLPRLKINTTP
ncbi:hypothetical protein ACFL6I_01130 [candidate division KSB1 bacterium]